MKSVDWPEVNTDKFVLDAAEPEYIAMMAPVPAVIAFVGLLPTKLLSKIMLFVVLVVASLKPADNLIAGVVVSDDVLVVTTLLLTVKLPVTVFTRMVPVDDRPE